MDKTALGILAALVVAAGAPAAIAEEPEGAEETVTVVVNMPNGRKVEVEEKAQPSRTTDSRPRAVRRMLPDGSVISYGIGDAKKKRRSRSSSRSSSSSNARSDRNNDAQRVSTLGSPRYDDSAATGGQDVRFFDAGISAMVIGRTVFIWGAELVQSDVDFEVVEGELFAFDGAVAMQDRYQSDDVGHLTGGESLFAPIKLEFEPDTQVTLTLHGRAANPEEPDRQVRTWTFRVR
ncbi:MAG: hypothetical protein AB8F26_03530 [Phycisphaerales bacterium]